MPNQETDRRGPEGNRSPSIRSTEVTLTRGRDTVVFSPREREVFQLIAQGYTYETGARALNIKPETFRAHASRTTQKGNCSVENLIIRGIRSGLLNVDAIVEDRHDNLLDTLTPREKEVMNLFIRIALAETENETRERQTTNIILQEQLKKSRTKITNHLSATSVKLSTRGRRNTAAVYYILARHKAQKAQKRAERYRAQISA